MRKKTPTAVETEVLVRSRRWCALCFGLQFGLGPRIKGQIAHVDRDHANSVLENLCWLCFDHHEDYDSMPSQAKRLTPGELRTYRDDLYRFLERERTQLSAPPRASLSPEAWVIAETLSARTTSGRKLDVRVRIDTLPTSTGLSADDVEIGIDELKSQGLVELNGTRDVVGSTDRFFWETDPLFRESDPAADAGEVARAIVAHGGNRMAMNDLATKLGWDARRLNPATSYLEAAGFVNGTATISGQYWTVALFSTPSTKRYVRDLELERANLAQRSV